MLENLILDTIPRKMSYWKLRWWAYFFVVTGLLSYLTLQLGRLTSRTTDLFSLVNLDVAVGDILVAILFTVAIVSAIVSITLFRLSYKAAKRGEPALVPIFQEWAKESYNLDLTDAQAKFFLTPSKRSVIQNYSSVPVRMGLPDIYLNQPQKGYYLELLQQSDKTLVIAYQEISGFNEDKGWIALAESWFQDFCVRRRNILKSIWGNNGKVLIPHIVEWNGKVVPLNHMDEDDSLMIFLFTSNQKAHNMLSKVKNLPADITLVQFSLYDFIHSFLPKLDSDVEILTVDMDSEESFLPMPIGVVADAFDLGSDSFL